MPVALLIVLLIVLFFVGPLLCAAPERIFLKVGLGVICLWIGLLTWLVAGIIDAERVTLSKTYHSVHIEQGVAYIIANNSAVTITNMFPRIPTKDDVVIRKVSWISMPYGLVNSEKSTNYLIIPRSSLDNEDVTIE